MRESRFWELMEGEFGPAYASTVARTHVLSEVAATSEAALAAGVSPRAVWSAICRDFDVPPDRALGRDPRSAP
ncbi:MAG TPA: DUF3046 domain-containing protein [Phycicoccus sp.]|nr:DUF3046 domain-containing protein [Phycicoccus sp.]